MTNYFEAIKKAAKTGWKRPEDGLGGWMHETLAEQCGLPKAVILVTDYGLGTEAEFLTGPLYHVKGGAEANRTKAAARLICEAREYLRREENAKTVTA